MNLRRDMWLALTVVFIFITMALSIVGVFAVASSWAELRNGVNLADWFRSGVRFWPIAVADAVTFLVAIFSYGKYKSFLE